MVRYAVVYYDVSHYLWQIALRTQTISCHTVLQKLITRPK